jgi:hypothetical protein
MYLLHMLSHDICVPQGQLLPREGHTLLAGDHVLPVSDTTPFLHEPHGRLGSKWQLLMAW